MIDVYEDFAGALSLRPGESNRTTYYGQSYDPFVRIVIEREMDRDHVLHVNKCVYLRGYARQVDIPVAFGSQSPEDAARPESEDRTKL